MKILVVDDEKLIRDVVKEYLQLDGFTVEEASNGDEAVALGYLSAGNPYGHYWYFFPRSNPAIFPRDFRRICFKH